MFSRKFSQNTTAVYSYHQPTSKCFKENSLKTQQPTVITSLPPNVFRKILSKHSSLQLSPAYLPMCSGKFTQNTAAYHYHQPTSQFFQENSLKTQQPTVITSLPPNVFRKIHSKHSSLQLSPVYFPMFSGKFTQNTAAYSDYNTTSQCFQKNSLKTQQPTVITSLPPNIFRKILSKHRSLQLAPAYLPMCSGKFSQNTTVYS